MVLDTERYELRYGIGVKAKEIYCLTKLEMAIINTLRDYKVHNIKELTEKINCKSENATRIGIMRLKNKIPILEIETRNRIGYILKSKIHVKVKEKENE